MDEPAAILEAATGGLHGLAVYPFAVYVTSSGNGVNFPMKIARRDKRFKRKAPRRDRIAVRGRQSRFHRAKTIVRHRLTGKRFQRDRVIENANSVQRIVFPVVFKRVRFTGIGSEIIRPQFALYQNTYHTVQRNGDVL